MRCNQCNTFKYKSNTNMWQNKNNTFYDVHEQSNNMINAL